MKTPRNVKRSLFAKLAALFGSAATFGTALNVYYEDDLRAGTTPTTPYVYLLDADIPFPVTRLPVVAVWARFSYRAFQLGGPSMWHMETALDVYGRNRGEREDLAAAIAEGVLTFDISDYSGGSISAWGTASAYETPGGEYWGLTYESVGDAESVEGTRLNWARCASQFWCKPT